MHRIDRFAGAYAFLSNFYPCTITFEGRDYNSTEHAYQAAKTFDEGDRYLISRSHSPGQAKRLGRSVTLRQDWPEVRLHVMAELLGEKFGRHPELAAKLLATGDASLIEGNTWNDTFWGVCQGKGENYLGRLLMAVRAILKERSLRQ